MDGASGVTSGREALAQLITRFAGRSIHTTTDAIIEVDGDRGHQSCTVIVYTRARVGQPHAVRLVARYDDELRRTPDGWRIAHRRVLYEANDPDEPRVR